MTACFMNSSAFDSVDLTDFLTNSFLFSKDIISSLDKLPLSILSRVIAPARSLSMHAISFHEAHLNSFLRGVPFQRLTTLNLSYCSTVTDEMLLGLTENNVALQELSLKGCRRIRGGAVLAQATASVQVLDLSWSGLSTLPTSIHLEPIAPASIVPEEDWSDDTLVEPAPEPVWPNLRSLNLTACDRLLPTSLATFLTSNDTFPSQLQTLNLSRLTERQLPLPVLSHLALTVPTVSSSSMVVEKGPANALTELDLRMVDYLTVMDVENLVEQFAGRRAEGQAVKVQHSAVLRSNTYEGYMMYAQYLMGNGWAA